MRGRAFPHARSLLLAQGLPASAQVQAGQRSLRTDSSLISFFFSLRPWRPVCQDTTTYRPLREGASLLRSTRPGQVPTLHQSKIATEVRSVVACLRRWLWNTFPILVLEPRKLSNEHLLKEDHNLAECRGQFALHKFLPTFKAGHPLQRSREPWPPQCGAWLAHR